MAFICPCCACWWTEDQIFDKAPRCGPFIASCETHSLADRDPRMAASCWRFSCDGCGGCHRCYLDDMATGSLCCLGNLYDCVTMEQLVKEANLRLALKREKYGVVIPPNIQEKAPMAKEMKLGAGAQVAPADEPHHH